MTTALNTASRLMRLATAGLVALVLSACMLTSPTDLVADDEAATPLPPSFFFVGYNGSIAEGFTRSDDAPTPYALEGNTYFSADRSIGVRFVPRADGSYLMAITGSEGGGSYGVARIEGDIIAMHLIFGEGLDAGVAATQAQAGANGSDIVLADGGIVVTKRETLDLVAAAMEDGTIPAPPLVAVAALTPDAATPARIVVESGVYRGE